MSNIDRSYDYLPGISIDCVIFGFHDSQLKILLLNFKNTDWFAVPGGFIKENENLDEAAQRILEERTGLTNIYLEQFYVFGDKNRRSNEVLKALMLAVDGKELSPDHYLMKRFLSIGYYALIDFTKATPSPDALSNTCEWYDIDTIPTLIYDHSEMVKKALSTLRFFLDEKLIGFNLLPEVFTMNDLQNLYETVLDTKLLRTNFQRKMLSLGILERLDKKMTGAANKAPYLYRFTGNS
ncbi:NUDIX hydrolase [Arcicella rigui]|uniref:NUDIX domain-containing protein n=1 Tax=Arcicella rigui TaxID=797020 RepID=A0ABU5Q4F0_9BACT|nr:NUDIX domain-containing protein [Arcicella rigui]MEA5137711.1 NUDIX domain-containing protein [Arcicella rigui]